jgi:putative drug exporter of the RND superfamily
VVALAGATVVVALLSLAVVDIPLVTMAGCMAAVVVAVTAIAAITLLPALLAILGDRIDSSRCRSAAPRATPVRVVRGVGREASRAGPRLPWWPPWRCS